jgi:hypothetical protein
LSPAGDKDIRAFGDEPLCRRQSDAAAAPVITATLPFNLSICISYLDFSFERVLKPLSTKPPDEVEFEAG